MDFDNELFAEELRRRIRLLLSLRNMSMAAVSRGAGLSNNSLKDFMNGRKQSVSLMTFLAWTRALDVPYQALIDGAGYVIDGDYDPFAESNMVDEERDEERLLRMKAAKNLKFLRLSLGKSLADFAKEARIFKGKKPDTAMIEAFEAGEKLIPPMSAMRLSEAFGFSVDDIYS